MKADKYRLTKYRNATSIKIPNRRVTVVRDNDNLIKIQFAKIGNEKWDCQEIVRNKILTTNINLTLEAAEALFFSLQNELTEIQRKGMIITN